MPRILCSLLLAIGLLAAAPRTGVGQDRTVRFEIVAVGDTMITLRTGDVRWISPGQQGIAVDPRRRDELVARFRVSAVARGEATAVITGQTTRITVEHVGVLEEPRPRWYRTRSFWLGITAGLLAGFAAGRI